MWGWELLIGWILPTAKAMQWEDFERLDYKNSGRLSNSTNNRRTPALLTKVSRLSDSAIPFLKIEKHQPVFSLDQDRVPEQLRVPIHLRACVSIGFCYFLCSTSRFSTPSVAKWDHHLDDAASPQLLALGHLRFRDSFPVLASRNRAAALTGEETGNDLLSPVDIKQFVISALQNMQVILLVFDRDETYRDIKGSACNQTTCPFLLSQHHESRTIRALPKSCSCQGPFLPLVHKLSHQLGSLGWSFSLWLYRQFWLSHCVHNF